MRVALVLAFLLLVPSNAAADNIVGRASVIDGDTLEIHGDPTLSDLGSRELVYVRCRCGHQERFFPGHLIATYGVDRFTLVRNLRPRFRCTKCQRRPHHVWIEKWRD